MAKVTLGTTTKRIQRTEGPFGPTTPAPEAKRRPADTNGAPATQRHALSGESAHHELHRGNGLGGAVAISDAKENVRAKKRVLVIDIGGTNVKLKAPGRDEVKIPSGKEMTPRKMVEAVAAATKGWDIDAVAIGYPGVVKSDLVATEPHNLGKGWVGFDFASALGKPVKMVNDAAMQALGSATKPGLTLFLGVGTGLGVALVLAEKRDDGTLSKRVIPTELGHARFSKKHDYESQVSKAALEGEGRKRWTKSLKAVVGDFQRLFSPDQIVIGGGNVKQLKDFRETFPAEHIVPGDNDFAFAGGEALWGQ